MLIVDEVAHKKRRLKKKKNLIEIILVPGGKRACHT